VWYLQKVQHRQGWRRCVFTLDASIYTSMKVYVEANRWIYMYVSLVIAYLSVLSICLCLVWNIRFVAHVGLPVEKANDAYLAIMIGYIHLKFKSVYEMVQGSCAHLKLHERWPRL
jgi:hypothetical protein